MAVAELSVKIEGLEKLANAVEKLSAISKKEYVVNHEGWNPTFGIKANFPGDEYKWVLIKTLYPIEKLLIGEPSVRECGVPIIAKRTETGWVTLEIGQVLTDSEVAYWRPIPGDNYITVHANGRMERIHYYD